MSKELYTYTCTRCYKVFRTDDPEQKVCSECLEYSKPRRKYRTKHKILTFAVISFFILSGVNFYMIFELARVIATF